MKLFAMLICITLAVAALTAATTSVPGQLQDENMSIALVPTTSAITKAMTAAINEDGAAATISNDNNYYMARTAKDAFESEGSGYMACTRPMSDVRVQHAIFMLGTNDDAVITVNTQHERTTVRTGIHARPASQIA